VNSLASRVWGHQATTAFQQLEINHERAVLSRARRPFGHGDCSVLLAEHSGLGRRLKHALGATEVAKIIAVIIIIVTGLSLAFGDTSGGFRRLIQIVFGLSIAFAASSFFLSFFSFGGGVMI